VKITLDLTDEQAACTLSCLPAGKGTDEERVTAYYQNQVSAIASGMVRTSTIRRLAAKGLPAKLAEVGLDADQLAALEAHADERIAAKVLAAKG
jgi:hypothetical protein